MSKRGPIDLRHMAKPANVTAFKTNTEAQRHAARWGWAKRQTLYVGFRFHAGWGVGYNIAAGELSLLTSDGQSTVSVPWFYEMSRRIP